MTFLPSQIILILAILLFILYVFRVRTLLIDRMIYMFLVSGGIVCILFPELSTAIANMVGIGRGADLIFYLFVIFSLFNHVGLVSHVKRLERQLTDLTRAIAVGQPLRAGPEAGGPSDSRPHHGSAGAGRG
jgi:hypothetical protein